MVGGEQNALTARECRQKKTPVEVSHQLLGHVGEQIILEATDQIMTAIRGRPALSDEVRRFYYQG